jgi:predicted MFS family arabinose efflux permease
MQTEDFVQRRKQRWILTFFFLLSGLLTASFSSRIPDIQHKLQLDNRSLGNVLFAIPVGLVTGLMLAGRLVARYGIRQMTRAGSILLALVLTGIAFASTPVQLVLALFLFGMCRTIFNLSINTGAVELQKQYEQPIVSRFHGIWSLACLAAAGIGTVMIIQTVRPLFHFAGMAGVAIGSTLLLLRKKNNRSPSNERRPLFVKPDKALFLLGLTALCAMLTESAMFDWSVNYFDKVVKADKGFVTTGYICFIGAMALGRLFGDRLIARFGIYRMLSVNGVSMAVGLLLAALFPSLLPASVGFLLIGFGDSMLVPIIYVLASQSKKMPSAYALQAVTMIGYGGFLIGPLFVGNVSQHWGMDTAFLFLSGISLLILLLSLKVKRMAVQG